MLLLYRLLTPLSQSTGYRLRQSRGLTNHSSRRLRFGLAQALATSETMRKPGKIVTWLASTSIIAIAAAFVVAWQMFGSLCGNEVIAEVPSPDGKYKVVVFQRDCGATTGFSTQLSLLPSKRMLDDVPGNIFVADTNHGAAPSGPGGGPSVAVHWLGSDALEVVHHPRARIFFSLREEFQKRRVA